MQHGERDLALRWVESEGVTLWEKLFGSPTSSRVQYLQVPVCGPPALSEKKTVAGNEPNTVTRESDSRRTKGLRMRMGSTQSHSHCHVGW